VASNRNASRFSIVQMVASRPRLFGCLLLGVVFWIAEPGGWRPITRFLIAWNLGVWLYLALALAMMMRADHHRIASRAIEQDDGRFVLLVVGTLAPIASIGAILAELVVVKDLTGELKALHIMLASATIVGSWLFTHMLFALHYAHEFYLERTGPDGVKETRGGLTFPSTSLPDYTDFLYFSYVIGVASQTADVSISSREMRHVSLAQSIVSFFFNTTVLALTINIAAGLV
jgi:uncharacterized membrane protein